LTGLIKRNGDQSWKEEEKVLSFYRASERSRGKHVVKIIALDDHRFDVFKHVAP